MEMASLGLRTPKYTNSDGNVGIAEIRNSNVQSPFEMLTVLRLRAQPYSNSTRNIYNAKIEDRNVLKFMDVNNCKQCV